jgi:formamidopyrimidine-DNA glycosylase
VPEGDVVWFTARRLHEALAGRVLTRSDFRVPRFATVDLRGQVVTEAVSRGKHLLIRTNGGLTVHTHLKMEGSWRIRPASATGASGGTPGAGSYKIRLLLANAEWTAIGYQLGIAEVLRTAHEERVVGHLGPDLLDPGWDGARLNEAVTRLAADANKARPIGEALLDQRNLAGIGTWYAAEVLFLRGVNPWRPAGEVDDLPAVVTLAHELLDANKTGFDQVATGDSRRGRRTWAYGRAGQPCRRCGTPIRKGEQGPPGQERLRFWCPGCQR